MNLDYLFHFCGFLSLSLILATLTSAFAITLTIFSYDNTAQGASSNDQTHLVYGCMRFGAGERCDLFSNRLDSRMMIGHVQPIYTVNLTKFEPTEGVFGNALSILGYRQQYLSVPNKHSLNAAIFSVSFWMKQDSAYIANSSIISHLNSAKTAGWYFSSYARNSQTYIQFSVANSDGRIFSVSSSFDPDIFQNVVGTFDGKVVKIYLNGFLVDSIIFVGNYNANPSVPLNLGLNSYDYGRPWTGALDEVRLYNTAISENEVQKLTDYSNYSYASSRSPYNKGVIAYWPFDEGMQDNSGNQNDGKIVLPAVSMAFSPDGRLFFSVKDGGEIRVMKQDGTVFEEPFVRLQIPNTKAHQMVLGITLDPDFATNHYVYAYTTAKNNDTGNIFNRVVRFTESQNRATDEKILVDQIPAGKGHELAGALAFGPDDKIYVATSYTANHKELGQNANLIGKVLRINRDGTIPSDNPFTNSSVYTLGHRKMFGIAFAKTSDMAIVAENDARNHDEINILKRGENYGFPVSPQLSVGKSQTDNPSAVQPVRTYYKTITPTQIVYYDGNKFPSLKNRFIIVSFFEGSIYALSLNATGDLVEEVAIRLPEVRGHIISIAKAPNGDLYIGGENLYKLVSIDRNTNAPLTYFIDVTGRNVQINDLSLNLTSKVMSLDIINKNNNNSKGNIDAALSPSVQVRVPKALLGGIILVTSERHNKTSTAEETIESFNIKESRRVTNVGDTIIDIQLKNNIYGDRILIKGQTSTLVQSPVRNTVNYR